MKENEALECLKSSKRKNDILGILPGSDIGNTIIKALEEVQQYREIGTLELCRMAVRKQTARRSLHQGCYDKDGVWHEWNGINGKPYELCPSCGVNLCCEMPINRKPNYCKECGQKLDWNRRTNDGKID